MASGPGDKYGLRLIMSVEQKEYNGRLSFSSGLRILVHNQSEPPLTRDFGFAVMPRSHVYAAISKHRVIQLLLFIYLSHSLWKLLIELA